MNKPDLSIVIAVRNDNYGGDFVQRLQRCIDWNTRWLEHYSISSEFVLVNWNPVAENRPLVDWVVWPTDRSSVEYRVLEVSEQVHQQFIDPLKRKTVEVFEFIAKNAGIRRAKGSRILCINADILIHPDIFEALAANSTTEDYYYRANRLDFRAIQEVGLAQMWQAGFAISLKGFMYSFHQGFHKQKQYKWFQNINSLRLKWELLKRRHSKLAGLFRQNVVYDNGAYHAHCLNSGDFMLMSRTNWLRLKAYPEYTLISTHTDAIFTILAKSSLREEVLDPPVFHQEHDRRYTWQAIQLSSEFSETFRLFETIAASVIQKQPIDPFLNDDSWGLNGVELYELTIGS